MWHLLTLGAMATCGWLAAWQWQRAGSAMGSALNIGYGLQWPVFAIFFGVMWWRMLRMEAAKLRDTELGEDVAEPVAAPCVSESTAEARTAPPRPATGPEAPSPFGPRPHEAPPVTDEDDPELAAYNRMLAQLAARHPEN
jgi:DNA-binding transcriptional regulator of glucitol operon